METTARRALSELIDQLCHPAAPEPVVEVPPTVARLLGPAPTELPQQRSEPLTVPAAFTVLPGGARSAILWRSR